MFFSVLLLLGSLFGADAALSLYRPNIKSVNRMHRVPVIKPQLRQTRVRAEMGNLVKSLTELDNAIVNDVSTFKESFYTGMGQFFNNGYSYALDMKSESEVFPGSLFHTGSDKWKQVLTAHLKRQKYTHATALLIELLQLDGIKRIDQIPQSEFPFPSHNYFGTFILINLSCNDTYQQHNRTNLLQIKL
jgi:hypothetical protein